MTRLASTTGLATLVIALLAGEGYSQPGRPGGPGAGGGRDPGRIFDRFANGQSTISISDLPPQMQQRLSQFLQEKGITGGQITRDQFVELMSAGRAQGGQNPNGNGPGNGPGGGMPGQRPGMDMTNPDVVRRFAEKRFNEMDANGDGKITKDEIAPVKLPELMKFDANGDGALDLEEFTAYIQSTMPAAPAQEPLPIETITNSLDQEARPVVYRAGKLPKGLPPWFEKFDTDKDGQVSLYEWRMAKESLDKFKQYDRNDDGFITVEEVLYVERLAKGPTKGQGDTPTASVSESYVFGPTPGPRPGPQPVMPAGPGQGGQRPGGFGQGFPPGGFGQGFPPGGFGPGRFGQGGQGFPGGGMRDRRRWQQNQ
jgi:Ca2+-binding EF-hand superfamily protein